MTAEQARVRWAKAHEQQSAAQRTLRALLSVTYDEQDDAQVHAARVAAYKAGCAEGHARKVYDALRNAAAH